MFIRNVPAVTLLFAALSAILLQAGSRHAGEQTAPTKVCTLSVSGMTCGGCATAVRMAAMRIAGVSDAKVSYEKGLAIITYDPVKTNPKAVAKTITEKTGFKTAVQKDDSRR